MRLKIVLLAVILLLAAAAALYFGRKSTVQQNTNATSVTYVENSSEKQETQTQNQEAQNIELYTLAEFNEGENVREPDIFINATEEMIKTALPDGKLSMAVNAFLIQNDGKNILIDTGMGINLHKNLKALGVTPEQIDVVLITHCHGDHISGLLKEGVEAFPNAIIYMSENEHKYWLGETSEFENVKKVFAPYLARDAVKQFVPDELDASSVNMLFPNIQPIALYGHTPGHTGFMIGRGWNKVFMWTDITHVMPVQMLYPSVSVSFDHDPVMAAQIRKKVLEYVAKNDIEIAGSHIGGYARGLIEAGNNGSYQFISPIVQR